MAGYYSTRRTYKNEHFEIIYLLQPLRWIGRRPAARQSAIKAVSKLKPYSYNFCICTSLFPTTQRLVLISQFTSFCLMYPLNYYSDDDFYYFLFLIFTLAL